MTQPLTLHIESISSDGQGVARHEGLVYFVDDTAPGETVTVEVTEKRKNFARARLISITTASPARITPPCPYYEQCGGCTYQHLAYSEQLRIKQQQVIDAFTRIGKITNPPIEPVVHSPDVFGYRNRITLHKRAPQQNTIGFFGRDNEAIIPIERCLLAHERLNNALLAINAHSGTYPDGDITLSCDNTDTLAYIEKMHLNTPSRKDSVVQIFSSESMQSFPLEDYLRSAFASKSPCLIYNTDGITLYYAPSSFFQINTSQLENITQHMRSHCTDGNTHLIDLYCGVGIFGIMLHDRYKQVVGIEENSTAIDFAVLNAKANALDHKMRFICDDAARTVPSLLKKYNPDECDIIVDPPRAGIAPAVRNALMQQQPRRLLYVSCDPATAARDLASLRNVYTLTTCVPFDMFPQTKHIETLSILRRK